MSEQNGKAGSQHPSSGEPNRRRSSRRRNPRQQSLNQPQPVEAEHQGMKAPVTEAQSSRPRTGNAAKPKRRNAPHRTAMPELVNEPVAVLRPSAPKIAQIQPMRMRQIDPTDTSEPQVGCPMLTRTRVGIPFRGGQRMARCSVGWAVHDEDEVLFCLHTQSAAQCWKNDAERIDGLVEELRPIIEAELGTH